MDLATVLQRLYDSEINVTIPTLCDGGYDFALISYMEWEEAGRPIDYAKMFISVELRDRPDRPDPSRVPRKGPVPLSPQRRIGPLTTFVGSEGVVLFGAGLHSEFQSVRIESGASRCPGGTSNAGPKTQVTFRLTERSHKSRPHSLV
jgi:hypothetical protein